MPENAVEQNPSSDENAQTFSEDYISWKSVQWRIEILNSALLGLSGISITEDWKNYSGIGSPSAGIYFDKIPNEKWVNSLACFNAALKPESEGESYGSIGLPDIPNASLQIGAFLEKWVKLIGFDPALKPESEGESYGSIGLPDIPNTSLQTSAFLDSLVLIRIRIPQPSEVQDYLLQHSGTADAVKTICQAVSDRFKESTQLSLEVYRDPEIQDEYLTLYVRQRNYNNQLLNIINEIETEHESLFTNKSGWLLVTTDFRPPI